MSNENYDVEDYETEVSKGQVAGKWGGVLVGSAGGASAGLGSVFARRSALKGSKKVLGGGLSNSKIKNVLHGVVDTGAQFNKYIADSVAGFVRKGGKDATADAISKHGPAAILSAKRIGRIAGATSVGAGALGLVGHHIGGGLAAANYHKERGADNVAGRVIKSGVWSAGGLKEHQIASDVVRENYREKTAGLKPVFGSVAYKQPIAKLGATRNTAVVGNNGMTKTSFKPVSIKSPTAESSMKVTSFQKTAAEMLLKQADYMYLNAPKGGFGMGHAAVAIGNDNDGWKYVSRDANHTNTQVAMTAKDLLASKDNIADIPIGQRYSRRITIKADAAKDQEMLKKVQSRTNNKYDFFKENCADAALAPVVGNNPKGITVPNYFYNKLKKNRAGQ